MADRIEPFSVTVPAGTPIATFAEFPLVFRSGKVDRLEVRVPPGPSGTVGFRIAHSGQSVIPYTGSVWVIADNELLDWDMDNYPIGSAWELWAYNIGVYDHTLHLRFHVSEIGNTSISPDVPIPIEPIGEAEEPEASPEDYIDPLEGEVPSDRPDND